MSPIRAFGEVEVEIVVAVFAPQFAAVDAVVEVERVEAADMRRVDEVPGAAEDWDAQAQEAAGGEDAMALTQPDFWHEMEVIENPKSEYRNPKQIRIPNVENPKLILYDRA